MKILSAAVTGAAVGALLLLGAAPASAAGNQLDPGDALYAINCDPVYNDWQLLSVDAATAVSTTIGEGEVSEDDTCAGQPAYNPATGVSYYIQYSEADRSLASIDPVTGESVTIGEFFYWNNEFPTHPLVTAMAIGLDGAAYALTQDGDSDLLWSVDLSTAELTFVGNSLCCTWALAVNPVDGGFYGIDTQNRIYEVDVTTGDYEQVGDVDFPDGSGTVYSLQFDGAGTFWVEADYSPDESPRQATLWSFALANSEDPVYSGIFDDEPYYTEALLLIPGDAPPQPVLPATGAEPGVAPVIAAGMLVLGVAIIATGRIRRRATA